MTKKDRATLETLPSILQFMIKVAADPRGYESTQMTVRAFYSCYRRFCQNNKLDRMLSLQGFAGQLRDFGIHGIVRDPSLPFEMVDVVDLREQLIADLGLNKRFFNDPESLQTAMGVRSNGIAGAFTL